MGFINKINKFGEKIGIGPNDNSYDDTDVLEDEFDDLDDDIEKSDDKTDRKDSIPPRRNLGSDKVVSFTSAASLRERDAQEKAEAQAAAIAEAANKPMEVVVIEPKTFDDSQQVSQCLMDKRPVVINFENTDTEVAHRIVDFISGTVYALDGDIRKISRNVFLCAPKNVTLTNGDIDSGLGDFGWMK